MTTQACPDQATLESFLLGKLTDTEQSAMQDHFENCSECASLANTLTPQDEITRAIRSGKVLTGDEAAVAVAVEKGKQLGSLLQTRMPGDDETVIGDKPQSPLDASESTLPPTTGESSEESIDFLAPPQQPDEIGRLGEYRVLQLLGAGGMGMVFRAEDTRLKRQVALKVMKPSVAANRSAKDRFLREAQFTAAIEHDNIVQIYQVGEDRGVPFIAMPFLKGESLKSRQERVGKLSQSDVIKVGIQVASGLAAAHERNLIHRDIKPDNIWIEEKTGRAKILDFGLVRATSEDAGLTQSGVVMGTPRYMAPEQAMGQDVDHRCDLFSLGSVLYHLASGRLPFEGSNVTATLMAVVQQAPKPLEAVAKGIDPDLSQIIGRLMSKDRDQRPNSAAEVAKSLNAVLQKLNQAPLQKAALPTPEVPAMVTAPPRQAAAPASPAEPLASGNKPPKKSTVRLAMAAAGAFLLLLFGTWIIIKDKDGKEVARLKVPEGGSATAEDENGKPVKVTTMTESGTKTTPSAPASDRALAEKWLAAGVLLQVNDQDTWLNSVDKLPPGEFRLTGVSDSVEALNDADFPRLAQTKSLKVLTTVSSITEAGYKHLEGHPHLQMLHHNAPGNPVNGSAFATFATLPELRELTGYCQNVSKDDARQLAALPKLEVLNLYGLTLTDNDCDFLLQFPSLKAVGLSNSPLGDGAAKILSRLPKLNVVYIGSTQLTDAGADHLAKMPALNALVCGDTQITDAGYKALARNPSLHTLAVENTAVTDLGVAALSGPQWKSLSLRGTAITDASVPVLSQLTNLVSLDVTKTQLTSDGVRKLQLALPKCQVVSDFRAVKPQ